MGSEMCIRDRLYADYVQAGQMPVILANKFGGVIFHEACLLYTSDAADEEDSVDLGGRRIIKKG